MFDAQKNTPAVVIEELRSVKNRIRFIMLPDAFKNLPVFGFFWFSVFKNILSKFSVELINQIRHRHTELEISGGLVSFKKVMGKEIHKVNIGLSVKK